MSLYTFEEVCEGCINAVVLHGYKRKAFDYCLDEKEEYVDHIRGRCPHRRTREDIAQEAVRD